MLAGLAGAPASAFEVEDSRTFGVESPEATLRMISTGDIDVFAPIILAYQREHPRIAVEYVAVSSTELMRAIEAEGAEFDVALSSAMDLQIKLANDGMARPHRSAVTETLPDWAVWRDRVFAFTREPATIILSAEAFADTERPATRQELIELLRADPERFRGRVGTYDIRDSGLGFLFATQDARSSDTYWRLMEVFGTLDVRLYCCSGAMIEDVAAGRLLVGYNVLGDYVGAGDAGKVEVVEPSDFTTVMMRTAIIPGTSPRPARAGTFLDFLLQRSWKGSIGPFGSDAAPGVEAPSHRPIPLGPGLLVYLDRLKKSLFLREWQSAIEQ